MKNLGISNSGLKRIAKTVDEKSNNSNWQNQPINQEALDYLKKKFRKWSEQDIIEAIKAGSSWAGNDDVVEMQETYWDIVEGRMVW